MKELSKIKYASPKFMHDLKNDLCVVDSFFTYCDEDVFEGDMRQLFINARETLKEMHIKMKQQDDVEIIPRPVVVAERKENA